MSSSFPQPQTSRIHALDALRGFALLGILIMNIQSFSMISSAYLNPTSYGDLNGINKSVWVWSHILADQKFLSIFSMLFGVGIMLFTESIIAKGHKPAKFYYRRLLWLLLFGLIHGYLFWHGDILVAYAICGAIAYLFRNLNPIVLITLAVIIFCIPAFNYWIFAQSMEMWPPEALQDLKNGWMPGKDLIDQELSALRGGIADQLKWRAPETLEMETFVLLIYMGWRALAMMLFGMAFYKLGLFSDSVKLWFQVTAFALCISVGLYLSGEGVSRNFHMDWDVKYSMFLGYQWNYFGSLFTAIAYVMLVQLIERFYKLNLLGKVGKMAFSTYLLTTVICTTIFYGHGFGLIGYVERWQQIVIVVSVWVVLLVFSGIWLKYYQYGPAEWLWRYLTYGKRPAWRKSLT